MKTNWMRLFYSLACRLITVQGFLALGMLDRVKISIDEAVMIVKNVDDALNKIEVEDVTDNH